ncbi:hypothetical protein [Crystallibacter degradans]|uniref:hypothetical protein n=1 Tax=Crystallibacter degradans TaxID=2726743 RepID=UPI00147422A5|nr:hypothetical protein [Arthrobacter sp. SF27]NMR28168.1 hypothetical protein [Arthrobacter sp. SF27]
MSTGHVVLLGESIFDNKAYVGRGPDVVNQLRDELPPTWQATLLAVDGDVISGVPRQLRCLPRDATHLVISAGGNDALGFAYLLQSPARSEAEVDLRLICNQDGDYANAIEPSVQGGAKIARAVAAVVGLRQDSPASIVIASDRDS